MKDGRIIVMEATLDVLIGGIDTERATFALCKFSLEMGRKGPYFRGLRSLNGLLIKIVGAMSNF